MRWNPLFLALGLAACTSSGGGGDGNGLRVSGVVRDFVTGEPVSGSISVSTHGLSPEPTVTVGGAEYALEGVTANSVFNVLAGAAPTYRSTYADAIIVEEDDLWDQDVSVLSETYLASLASSFGVQPSAANGVLLAHAVDGNGAGLAGVPAAAFVAPDGAIGPFFLDASLAPAPALDATSSSGWVVFFEVPAGVVGLSAADGSGYTLDMTVAPIAPAAATLATVHVTAGETTLPSNVSFSNDVVSVFQRRGCAACHSGSGPGKDLANLTLDGGNNLVYRELHDTAVTSTTEPRVNLASPEDSLVLTMPSAESPADPHPNVTFTGPLDPDYLTILVWIREGARQN